LGLELGLGLGLGWKIFLEHHFFSNIITKFLLSCLLDGKLFLEYNNIKICIVC